MSSLPLPKSITSYLLCGFILDFERCSFQNLVCNILFDSGGRGEAKVVAVLGSHPSDVISRYVSKEKGWKLKKRSESHRCCQPDAEPRDFKVILGKCQGQQKPKG